jgi:hypothetical protein
VLSDVPAIFELLHNILYKGFYSLYSGLYSILRIFGFSSSFCCDMICIRKTECCEHSAIQLAWMGSPSKLYG